jgi:hypothetical protein
MIERQVQPEMLTFVSTDEVVALFQMFVFFLLPSVHRADIIGCSFFEHVNV